MVYATLKSKRINSDTRVRAQWGDCLAQTCAALELYWHMRLLANDNLSGKVYVFCANSTNNSLCAFLTPLAHALTLLNRRPLFLVQQTKKTKKLQPTFNFLRPSFVIWRTIVAAHRQTQVPRKFTTSRAQKSYYTTRRPFFFLFFSWSNFYTFKFQWWSHVR